ncbi:MAG: hypothetical protein AAFY73_15020, partial [Pseudomonadota bacterium]
QRAEATYGELSGGVFANKALRYVQAMRLSRVNIFRFSNPFCACCQDKLTEHERLFISALGCVRDEAWSEASTHAMILCEGHSTSAMLDAAERLCDWYNDLE